MALRNLKAGDVVELKSGSPKMTVTGEDYLGNVICVWFDGSKSLEGTFPEEALKKSED